MKRTKVTLLGLLLALSVIVQTTTAQYLPMGARVLNSARVPLLNAGSDKLLPLVEQVGAIGMTVSDIDASVDFYSKVLSFEKVSDVEVTGEDYERLQGVFGLRMRVVRMRLGDESIELTEYLTPRGRPVPPDSRGNDRWFQHIAIIVSDMDRAYAWLRQHRVQHASPAPERLEPDRGGDPCVLLQGSRRPLPRDPLVPARQGRCPLAPPDQPAVSRHRSHRDRGGRYRPEPL